MNKERQQIITLAFDLFSQYGIKSVSMDDIARNVGISKRTLYGYFADKESLLVEGITFHTSKLVKLLSQLQNEDYTAIDIALLFNDEILKRPRWYNKKFYDDLKKFPKAMDVKEEERSYFIGECKRLLERGVKEEVFQPGVNFEILALLAREQVKMIPPSKIFSKHTNAEVFNTVLITFLRGISTEKGRKILDRWINVKRISVML